MCATHTCFNFLQQKSCYAATRQCKLKKTRPCQDYHLQQKMSDVRLGRRKNHGNLRIRCDVWNSDSLDITLCPAKHWYAQVLLTESKSRFETNLKAFRKWFNMTWIPCFGGIPALAFSHSSILQQKVPGCPNQCSCSLIATLPQNGATFERETWPANWRWLTSMYKVRRNSNVAGMVWSHDQGYSHPLYSATLFLYLSANFIRCIKIKQRGMFFDRHSPQQTHTYYILHITYQI